MGIGLGATCCICPLAVCKISSLSQHVSVDCSRRNKILGWVLVGRHLFHGECYRIYSPRKFWEYYLKDWYSLISGTVEATTLTEEQMPRHVHAIGVTSSFYYASYNVDRFTTSNSRSTDTTPSTDYTGGSLSHDHSFSASTNNANILPLFYSLSYIIRVA